jgi:L-ascorbate 6-phosphate lactonase
MEPMEKLLYSDGKTSLIFVAQAGFILKSSKGTTMGIDLYLTDCVERYDGFKRLSPKVFRPEQLELDYVAATHWHLDHFDIDAMPLLMANRRTKLICAEDCRMHAENLRLDGSRVEYIRTGSHTVCDDITLDAVFCDHGTGAPLAVGLVLTVDGRKIYIAGDTALRLDKAPEVAAYGPFDVMIAPINGAFGNLNEAENVRLCAFHRPKLSVPCHFWTFAEQHGDPGVYMELMQKELPEQKYCIPAPGEQIFL